MERKTIKEVYLAWREMKVRLVKESTFATYVTNAEKHILPVLGDMHSVKESNVQQFVLDKLKAGLSQRTVRDILLRAEDDCGLWDTARMARTLRMGHQVPDNSRETRVSGSYY